MSNQENNDVFSEILFDNNQNSNGSMQENAGTIRTSVPAKVTVWSKFRNFMLQDIPWDTELKITLTPHQQKVENEVNDFLHQEITWGKVYDFLFQEVKFGKNK